MSVPGPDYILWSYFKILVTNNKCIFNIVNIANTCINLRFWPFYFKKFMFIIILKLNKLTYDFPKTFHLIIFFNMFGKLIEKVISKRLQIYLIVSNFIHLNQLKGLKQCFTLGAVLYLTYLIYTRWIKSLHTSILVFNIAQFFPSLNYQLFLIILDKARFNPIIFFNYLINRKTQYIWNNFVSSFFRADIGINQGSALFPILSTLYITSIFHIFEKRTQNLLSSIFCFYSFLYR